MLFLSVCLSDSLSLSLSLSLSRIPLAIPADGPQSTARLSARPAATRPHRRARCVPPVIAGARRARARYSDAWSESVGERSAWVPSLFVIFLTGAQVCPRAPPPRA